MSPAENKSIEVLEELATLLSNPRRQKPLVLFVGAGVTGYLSEFLEVKPSGWVSWGELADNLRLQLFPQRPSADWVNLGVDSEHPPLENLIGLMRKVKGSDPAEFYDSVARLFWTNPHGMSLPGLITQMKEGHAAYRWRNIWRLVESCDAIVTTNFDPTLQFICDADKDAIRAWSQPIFCPWHEPIPRQLLSQVVDQSAERRHLIYLHGGFPAESNDSLAACVERCPHLMLEYENYLNGYPAIEMLPYPYEDKESEFITRNRFLFELSQRCDLLYIGYSISDYPIRAAVSYGLIRSERSPFVPITRRHYAILNRGMKNSKGEYVLTANPLGERLRQAVSAQFYLKAVYLEEIAHAADMPEFTAETEGSELGLRPSTVTSSSGLDEVFKDLYGRIDRPELDQANTKLQDLVNDATQG